VDVRNDGAIPNLPAEAVVELPARIGRDGARPLPTSPLAPEMLGLVQHMKAYEALPVEAALSGDDAVALRALLAIPLVPGARAAAGLLEALIEANLRYLPRFASHAAGDSPIAAV
jgi:6-phospho-beta-glucosidase